jgi:ech hydrogenase subunit A
MNGLVFSDNLLWLYFFWEVTTFCSFMLIGHDRTREAAASARRALTLNMLGGVFLLFGIMLLYGHTGSLSIQESLASGPFTGMALLPLALFCLAAFTKSAQFPFQSWLLGAMVAPTPVSALLHSSTMVNAGVYLTLRMLPGIGGTQVGTLLALYGAFTFLFAALLALGQRNGKRILAYSTISNLGLIFACTGIGTNAAASAAILLIIFHAISKGLLFLCVGGIEQRIGSRNIEDMRGLVDIMPRTAMMAAIGMVTLFLPPFGALLSKWMAVEASAHLPLVVIMLALGSALTMVFWGRWLGMIMTSVVPEKALQTERMALFISVPLWTLAVSAVVISFAAPGLYTSMVLPVLERFYSADLYIAARGVISNNIGMFAIYPVFVVMALGVIYAVRASSAKRFFRRGDYVTPYVCGLQDPADSRRLGFKGPLGVWSEFKTTNYYMENIIGESRITGWINLVAIGILIILLAGVF